MSASRGRLAPRRTLRTWHLALLLGVVVAALVVVLAPEFYQARNLVNVSRQASIIGVVAVGMTIVILTGGIDLSVGSTLALTTVIVAILGSHGLPMPVAALAAVAVGAVAGSVNGLGVALLRIQPFVMTLATMVAIRGIALRITDGGPRLFDADGSFVDFFGSGRVLGVPGPFVVFIVVAAIGWAVLRYTSFGRYLYALGGSAEAARLSGVPITWTTIRAYVVSGGFAGLAGFMTAARLSIGNPSGGNLLELDAIAAVVIGGTSLAGGVGGMIGTVLGALLLAVVSNVMNLMGVSPFDQYVIQGVLIVVAVLVGAQTAGRRSSGRRPPTASTTTDGSIPDPRHQPRRNQ